MNRKKKIKTILKAKAKKTNAKLQKPNKPKYISKADRAALDASSVPADATSEMAGTLTEPTEEPS